MNKLFNCFLPTLKLEAKGQLGSRLVRQYGPVLTPRAWVLACTEVPAQTKAKLQAEKQTLNTFALRREVERQLKMIEAHRRAPEA